MVSCAGLNATNSKVRAHFVEQAYAVGKTIMILAMDVTGHLELMDTMSVLQTPVVLWTIELEFYILFLQYVK